MNRITRLIRNRTDMKIVLENAIIIFLAVILFGCSGPKSNYLEIDHEPLIDPDYSGITIPPNIAPLNFIIKEKADKYQVRLCQPEGRCIIINSGQGKIMIPSGRWKRLLNACKGNKLRMEVYLKKGKKWVKYQPIINDVAEDPIDQYLVYRIFDQGYLVWNKMGIYQRNLENFDESPVMVNTMSERNCMNCHSFCNNDSKTMLFHMRGRLPGTIFYRDGKITRVNTKTKETISPGVYPSWHPGGRYVAFSLNHIAQAFYASQGHMREAIDSLSDIILFDTETNKISTCTALASKERLETFPSWSPDGQYLYFVSTDYISPERYREMKYDLLRIAFNQEDCHFGDVDTIVSSARTGLSASFPRISPDGKYLLFCMTKFGNFTVWHTDSDLFLMNLGTKEISKPAINSDFAESYHSWSSNGRWIVFSSRRYDNSFTRPYFAYFDSGGIAHKPFILPQKNPEFYKTFIKTYNVPEFVTSPIVLNPRILYRISRSNVVNASIE